MTSFVPGQFQKVLIPGRNNDNINPAGFIPVSLPGSNVGRPSSDSLHPSEPPSYTESMQHRRASDGKMTESLPVSDAG